MSAEVIQSVPEVSSWDASTASYDDLLDESHDKKMQLQPDTLQEENIAPGVIGNSDNFISDHSVPSGWSFGGSFLTDSFIIKSPTGAAYKSRRDALEDMIVSGMYSYQDVMVMKECLKYEGWEESEDVPDGWMIHRSMAAPGVVLMEQGGKVFLSVQDALDLVKMFSKYYASDAAEKLSNILLKTSNQDYFVQDQSYS